MNGLDDYITGKYDPSAPFNQTDWLDQFSPIVDECEWIDEVMLNDEPTYNLLGEVLTGITMPKFCLTTRYYTVKERSRIILSKAKEIAIQFKKDYDSRRIN